MALSLSAAVAAPKLAVKLDWFKKEMLGPCFHLASSAASLWLVEKLVLDYAVAPWASKFDALEASLGRMQFAISSVVLVSSAAYWGIGGLFAVPACLDVKDWKIQRNKSTDFGALLAAMPLVIFNFLVGGLFYALLLALLLPESSFEWRALPSNSTLVRDVSVWLLLHEVSFFYVHKFFHEKKWAYALVHKLHHTWTAPVSLVAAYCHPFENIVANIMPMALGPLLCRSHMASVLIFTFMSMIHVVGVHSGYWFCDDSGMHDEHHAKFSVNYGAAGLMDSLYGSYRLPAAVAPVPPTKEL